MRNFLYIILLLLPLASMAQPGEAPVVTHDGKQCYEHKVERRQTLWGIKRMYDVSIDDIKAMNPEVEDGLKTGQIIYIPIPSEETTIEQPDLDPELDDSVKYITHIVKRGETLYRISVTYKTTVEKIEALNPFVSNGLQPGMELRIPKQPGSTGIDTPGRIEQPDPINTTDVQDTVKNDSIYKYVVIRGETLYSLSRRFMLTQQDLKDANEGLVGGLKVGDTLNIPLYKISSREVLVREFGITDSLRVPSDSVQIKDEYRIAVLVPFFLEENARYQARKSIDDPKDLYRYTENATQFYMGFAFALDSLRKAGLKVKVDVYDTHRDSGRVMKWIAEGKLDEVDLIFGPFYTDCIKVVAEFALEHEVPVILPVTNSNKVLFQNPYVSKAMSSGITRLEGIAQYIAEFHSDANIILVKSGKESDEVAVDAFRNAYEDLQREDPDLPDLVETGLSYSKDGGLKGPLSIERQNIVVAPSMDLLFVSNLVTKLMYVKNSYDYYKAEFALFGMEEWQSFESIDINWLHSVNLHISASTFIDHDSTIVRDFIRDFRDQYKTDPSEQAFLGFDLAYTYLSGLMEFGTGLPGNMGRLETEGLHLNTRMEQVEEGSGFENGYYYILKYQDFDLLIKNPPESYYTTLDDEGSDSE